MKGPFIATLDIGAPFKVQSESYTIAASDITPKRNIWLTVVILAVVAPLVIIQFFRTKRKQVTR